MFGAIGGPLPNDGRQARSRGCNLSLVRSIGSPVAQSIDQMMDDLLAHPALTGKPAAATIEPPSGTSPEQAAALLAGTPEVAGWYSIAPPAAQLVAIVAVVGIAAAAAARPVIRRAIPDLLVDPAS